MKMKKILASLMVGAMVMTTVPVINASYVSTAYAAKGGAKIGGGAKSAAPKAAPKTNTPSSNNSTSKSVSGNGETYKPSKDAKSLDKNAPAANSKSNANANTAANAQSGSRWGSALRTIGLFAGGMLLGSMLGNLFGSSLLGDVFGLIANVLMLMVAFMAIRWLWNKFRNRNKENVYASRMNDYNRHNAPVDIAPRQNNSVQDIQGPSGDYNARNTADKYRNR
ncbi:hypothetical protein [Selenomonas sp. AE3005]|jgi:predicted lipid-binding transport protein (Tim44 family)|uniref:hypothetical protein n=1 Tax=Selenomonas sp. AE3005 TaxID=1485543 RepID=UPI0004822886|nr:hypothetical protein [Selenomonas sp. AE3005]